jgi:hypothetical protein
MKRHHCGCEVAATHFGTKAELKENKYGGHCYRAPNGATLPRYGRN